MVTLTLKQKRRDKKQSRRFAIFQWSSS